MITIDYHILFKTITGMICNLLKLKVIFFYFIDIYCYTNIVLNIYITK